MYYSEEFKLKLVNLVTSKQITKAEARRLYELTEEEIKIVEGK